MTNEEILEAIEVMDKLSPVLFDDQVETFGCNPFGFELHTNGDCVAIEFLGYPIWSSENDERAYLDDEDDYETLEDFLRRKANNLLKVARSIKIC